MSSSPGKKKRRKKKEPSPRLPSTPNPKISRPKTKGKQTATTKEKNPPLSDDLLLSCFARVSRLYYPSLSLVSKSFPSLLASRELYKTRSLLGQTESSLYACFGYDSNLLLYTLSRKPDQTLANDTEPTSGYVLAKVPIPPSHRADFPNLVAVGSNIYKIGGSNFLGDPPSSSVSILDCMSHTWREGPSLRVKLSSLTASVFDRKIYVAGCGDSDSEKNSFHVLDTTTETWDTQPIPCCETKEKFFYSNSAFVDGKFHVTTTREEVAYDPKKGRWDLVKGIGDMFGLRGAVGLYLGLDSYCEIENLLYCFLNGKVRWFDTEVSHWRTVNGLEGLRKFGLNTPVRLADYGGKMVVFWKETCPFSRQHMIWCAEITLERHNREIWGKVEWYDHVLSVPVGCILVKVLTVTV